MKKVFLVISALALIAGVFESCKKEEKGGSGGESSKFTFTATIADNGTKVSYSEVDGDLKPAWVVDDQVIGFDDKSKTYTFKVTSIDSEGAATFERINGGTATSDPANDTKMYIIYAPGTSAPSSDSQSIIVDISSQGNGDSGSNVPALMMASGTVKNNKLTLRFENKTAIIGIKNPTIPSASSTSSITLTGTTNNKVTFGLNGTTLEATYGTVDGTNGKITKAVSGETVASGTTYIVACPESGKDLTFTTNNGESFTKSSKTMVAGNYYYMTPTFKGKPVLLPGDFSVGNTKKVKFTSGNLWWGIKSPATSADWHIESSQTDYAKTSSGTTWDSSHVGHFFWTKTAANSYAQTYSDGTCTISDTFFCDGSDAAHSLTVDGQSGLYALSKDEWVYLITTRGTSLRKYGVTVGGKSNCLVIAPDGFTGTLQSSYSLDDLNAAGLVCLPPAGYRSDAGLSLQGDYGCYWSSTPYEDYEVGAYNLNFGSYSVSPDYSDVRYSGNAIRLVYAAQ